MDEAEWKTFVYKIWNDSLTRYSIISVVFVSTLLAVFFSLISGLLVLTSYVTGFFIFKSIFSSRPEAPDFLNALGFSPLKSYELSPLLHQNPAFCGVCGDGKCKRHRPSIHPLASQPWLGLDIPYEVDKALEDFLNQALNQFIYSWYEDLSTDEDFVKELRSSVRYAICIFLRRLLKLNIPAVILHKFVPVALCHIEDYLCSIREAERVQLLKHQHNKEKNSGGDSANIVDEEETFVGGLGALEEGALKLLRESGRLHPATHSREHELKYLRQLTSKLLPHLLPPLQLKCKNWCALVQELLSGWVLLPALDVVADPNTINFLLMLAITPYTGSSQAKKKDGDHPQTVSMLGNFASSSSHANSAAVKSALRESLSSILKDQSLLYPFMQFLKKEGAVNILQFCLDVEDFNRKILNPELDKQEIFNLYQEAWDLYSVYFRVDSPDRIIFSESIVEEMKEVLSGPAEDIVKLRTTTPLFQAYEHAYNMLENSLCPMFHQSEEYYMFLCGQKDSAQVNKSGNSSPSLHGSPAKGRSSKKQSEGWGVSKLSSKIQKIRGALRSSPIEGQTVFYTDPGDISGDVVDAGDLGEADFVDETDDLDCDADFIEVEESSGRSLEPRDLSAWRVTIPNVQVRREVTGNSTAGAIGGNTRNPGTTFLIHIRRIDVQGEDVPSESNWTVERKYSDFYLLESKLVEFHGEFPDNHLPPKRVLFGPKGAEFMHSRRPIFEEYLQKLLQMPNLKGSDLLHTFLRSPYDFASSNAGGYLGLGGPPLMVGGMVSELNLGRMIRRTTLPLRLRKEKGQHLEPFLSAFINSTMTTSTAQVASSSCSSVASSLHASPSVSQGCGNTLVPEIPVQRVKTSTSNMGGKFEWTDMTEEGRRTKGRCLTRSVFGNNFGLVDEEVESEVAGVVPPKIKPVMGITPVKSHPKLALNSVFDCFLYLAVRVFGAGEFAVRIFLTLGVLLKNTFNSFCLWLVDYLLRMGLSTAHIALLLRLLKGAVFTQKSQTVKQNVSKAAEMSKRFKEVGPALMSRFNALPFWIRPFVLRVVPGFSVIHSSLQSPPLNKQLAYSLLDVLALELFPELPHPVAKK